MIYWQRKSYYKAMCFKLDFSTFPLFLYFLLCVFHPSAPLHSFHRTFPSFGLYCHLSFLSIHLIYLFHSFILYFLLHNFIAFYLLSIFFPSWFLTFCSASRAKRFVYVSLLLFISLTWSYTANCSTLKSALLAIWTVHEDLFTPDGCSRRIYLLVCCFPRSEAC